MGIVGKKSREKIYDFAVAATPLIAISEDDLLPCVLYGFCSYWILFKSIRVGNINHEKIVG